jgi:hypothetical protein
VHIIHPTEPGRDGACTVIDLPAQEKAFPRIYTADPTGIRTKVASLLQFQILGYQSLREKDFKEVFHRLFGALAEVIVEHESAPARYGHSGRYLFVWDNLLTAGLTAVQFMAVLQSRKTEWPSVLDFKMGLHTAPVQVMVNPILNQYAHEGSALAKLEALATKVLPGVRLNSEAADVEAEPGRRTRHGRLSLFISSSMCVMRSGGKYVLGIIRDGVRRL